MKRPIRPTKVVPTEVLDPITIQEQVRARAYEIFETRGCEAGHELEDWLRAEEEIKSQKNRASAA